MGLKEYAAKALFGGYIQQQVNQLVASNISGLVNANLFRLIGEDQPVLTHDQANYVERGMSVGPVYECVDLIMKKVVASPPILYEVKDPVKLKAYDNYMKAGTIDGFIKARLIKAEAVEEVTVKKISDLFKQPNERQTWDDFLGLIALLYLYDGNCLVYGNAGDLRSKKWTDVWSLPYNSKQFGMKGGSVLNDRPIKSYYVQMNGGDVVLDFPAEQIEHIKTINPTWDANGAWLYGISPLRAYLGNLLRDKLGDEAANKILNNGGAFGVLAPKDKEDQFKPDQKKALHERITDAQRSKDPMARIFPSSVALEWLQIGLPATDLQLLEMLKVNREDIYRAYHVPLVFASNEAATYNNLESANKQFIYNAVAPVCEVIAKALTNFICRPYSELKNGGKDYIIRLDYTSLPELSQDMNKVAEALEKMDYLTDNEKREVLGWGKISKPEYDTAYKNKSKAPIERIFNGEALNTRDNDNQTQQQ